MYLLKDILKKININIENETCEIKSIKFYQQKNRLEIVLHDIRPLSFDNYYQMLNVFNNVCKLNEIILSVEADNCEMDIQEFHKYLTYFSKDDNLKVFKHAMPSCNDNQYNLCFYNDADNQLANNCLSILRDKFIKVGFNDIKMECILKNINCNIDDRTIEKVESNNINEKIIKPNTYRKLKLEDYTKIDISSIQGPMDFIQFRAKVFNIEEITSKAGRIIQTISVHDNNEAILIKRYEGKFTTADMLHEIKVNDEINVYGSIVFDNFSKDLVCNPKLLEKVEPVKIVDDEKYKRIELHAHTTMSEMDAVCDVKDLISFAFNLGHKGIAICDHAGVQAFAKAHNHARALSKGREEPFKVLYGCEMNMVDEQLTIVRNSIDEDIDNCEYIAFDLETTGLSCYFDHIIEFGAVKIKDQAIVDRKQMFIKPPVPIPEFIQEKTNITNDHVKDAKEFNEVCDELLEWIGDGILVAHNASFDYGFLNEELKRIGEKPLTNPVIDTLDFSRSLFKNRRSYSLGHIARQYGVAYDEEVAHRADYDAEVLASVFNLMLKDAEKNNIKSLIELSDFQSKDAFAKKRALHTTVLCKNKEGLKDLFKLVSISNTDTLAIFGKANTKGNEESEFIAEPRIFRDTLNKYRENLLIGSACFNGEVFEIAQTRSREELKKAIAFYDYIELQPLENYRPLIEDRGSFDLERLKQY